MSERLQVLGAGARMAETFPFYLPHEARRLYTSEGVVRRIALTAHWNNGAKVLELYGSLGGISLARDLGCDVTLADVDDASVKALEAKVKEQGLSNRVHVSKVSMTSLPFQEGSQDGLLVLGRILAPLEDAVVRLRKYLALRGRLVLTYPVRVGLRPVKSSLEMWEKRLGEALRTPRECLMAVEKHGYEPETIETPAESELDDYYRSVEAALSKVPASDATAGLRQELEAHQDGGGRTGVSLALIVARRKEPGERPPAARDGG